MTIVRTKPDDEDSSLQDLLRISELERQNQQRHIRRTDEISGNDKQMSKCLQSKGDSSAQFGNGAALSNMSQRASELDLVIEVDNGETTHI